MNNSSPSTQSVATKEVIQSWVTGSLSPDEVLERLDSYQIEWFLVPKGDLMVKVWQIGAEDFVPTEQVARILDGRSIPSEASALAWVSQHLSELRETYAGKWIAVVGDRVVAASPSLPGLTEQFANMDVGTPFITEIPSQPVVWHTAYAKRII